MIRFLATALGSAIVMAWWLAVREERVRQSDTVTEHDGTQWTWTVTNTGEIDPEDVKRTMRRLQVSRA